MKRLFIASLLAMAGACLNGAYAQFHKTPDESALPGKRGILNVRNAQYPRLLPDNRMEFKVKAPNAQKVKIDLGKKYDLTKNADG